MKKVFLILFICSGCYPAFAQHNEQDPTWQMEQFQQEMNELLKKFQGQWDGSFFKMDTLYFRDGEGFEYFGEGEGLKGLPEVMEKLDMSKILELLSQSMKDMDSFDWAPMEEFFENFDVKPLVPRPEDLEPQEEQLKKKKAKIYKL